MAPKSIPAPAKKKMMAAQMAANLGGTSAPGKKRVLCLHAGSAASARMMFEPYVKQGWEAVWLSPEKGFKPDILAHPAAMKDIPSGSFDAVWSPHTLKHLYTHEVLSALKECFRVLKMDGEFRAFTPDLELVCEMVSRKGVDAVVFTTKKAKLTGLDLLYGYKEQLEKGDYGAVPKTGFTGNYLAKTLRELGFRDISLEYKTCNVWATAYKRAEDTEKNRIIRVMGDEVNARMKRRDTIERPTEKPVDTNFPFKL